MGVSRGGEGRVKGVVQEGGLTQGVLQKEWPFLLLLASLGSGVIPPIISSTLSLDQFVI
jgi:hypothetical protein